VDQVLYLTLLVSTKVIDYSSGVGCGYGGVNLYTPSN